MDGGNVMSFARYPTYKDSGVEWLGEVPGHWAPKKIRAISSLKGRLGWQGLKADEYREEGPYVVSSAHFEDRRIQWEECPRVSQERYDTDENIQLAAGDVLLMKDGAAMGKLAFVDGLPGPACLNSHLLLFRPIAVDGADAYSPKFAFYFMQTGYFQEHIKVNGTGATFLGISQDAIGRYEINLPPLPEQLHIAAFLDRETAKIDALVAEQQRLIELLKEKRQAVISHAVTKGLNPAAPMKDSGIEWLGEVPAHWGVKPLCRFPCLVQAGPFGSQLHAEEYVSGGIPLVNPTNMVGGLIVPNEEVTVLPEVLERLPHQVLRAGDVVFSRRGELGRCALVTDAESGWLCGTGSMILRLDQGDFNPEYLSLYLSLGVLKQYFESLSIGAIMDSLSSSTLLALSMLVPPVQEQNRIVTFLEGRKESLDTLTAEAQRAIDLLQERRTALISAAVTGQIDVRPASERASA